MRTLSLLVCWLLTASTVRPAVSQTTSNSDEERTSVDKIWYGPAAVRNRDIWNLHEGFYFEGSIQEFNATRLVFLDAKGQKRELESYRVERVEPVWGSAQAVEVHRAFCARRYSEITKTLNAALASGIPHWQQRLLTGQLVDAADALGRTSSACVFFLELAKHDPPPMLYATMPLCWTAREPDKALQTAAEKWLTSVNDHEGLLGSSWLLNSHRTDEAKQRLEKLKAGTNKILAQLATAQLWRLVSPPETKSNLANWFEFRDRMLLPLQIGPTEFLADRLGRVSMSELAVGEWTRIATLHLERYHRASLALEAARNLLQRENRPLEAERYAAWIEQLQDTQPSGQQ